MHRDAFFGDARARPKGARRRVARGERGRRATAGWWGENSEERVFHEVANMREMAPARGEAAR